MLDHTEAGVDEEMKEGENPAAACWGGSVRLQAAMRRGNLALTKQRKMKGEMGETGFDGGSVLSVMVLSFFFVDRYEGVMMQLFVQVAMVLLKSRAPTKTKENGAKKYAS